MFDQGRVICSTFYTTGMYFSAKWREVKVGIRLRCHSSVGVYVWEIELWR